MKKGPIISPNAIPLYQMLCVKYDSKCQTYLCRIVVYVQFPLGGTHKARVTVSEEGVKEIADKLSRLLQMEEAK